MMITTSVMVNPIIKKLLSAASEKQSSGGRLSRWQQVACSSVYISVHSTSYCNMLHSTALYCILLHFTTFQWDDLVGGNRSLACCSPHSTILLVNDVDNTASLCIVLGFFLNATNSVKSRWQLAAKTLSHILSTTLKIVQG